jgi:hypothetical protein
MSEEETNIEIKKKKNENLREALTQVLFQNKMMLNWVNGAVITVDRD